MTPEEFIQARCCDENGKVIRDTITIDEAQVILRLAREDERKKATAAFRHFVVDYCGETGRTDISMAAGHHIKMFEDILNKEE